MTILQSLNSYYKRLDEQGLAVARGWSREWFGWCIILGRDGAVIDVEDLRDLLGGSPVKRQYTVPASFKRSGTKPPPFFLWDKTSYSLGIETDGKSWKETPFQHALFKEYHLQRLMKQEDMGLMALVNFLRNWVPATFGESRLKCITPDANVMFRLDGERRFIHERTAARALVEAGNDEDENIGIKIGCCLITGEEGPIERIHQSIRGVDGANTSGASIVAFKQPCSQSYNNEQGDNAPTSKAAAFQYTTALNHLLTRDGPNRLPDPVGDATVVFWADSSDVQAAEAADKLAAQCLGTDVAQKKDATAAVELRKQMEQIAAGRPMTELRPDIKPGTKFHVLGLSPNAARLSVRFWLSSSFDEFARNLAWHYHDLAIEPVPRGWGAAPSVNRLLVETCVPDSIKRPLDRMIDFKKANKYLSKNNPQLAGEVMRAVLLGTAYPLSFLSAVLIRLRAGDPRTRDDKPGDIGWHAAAIRAVLVRLASPNRKFIKSGVPPMSLQRDYDNPGYQLGRLFAVYEEAQRAALGQDINATIRDKFFSAASTNPAGIFPLIACGGQNHLAKVLKDNKTRGWAIRMEHDLDEIYGHIGPQLPRSLNLKDQGEFVIGYYHQRAAKMKNHQGDEDTTASVSNSSKGDEE